MFEWDSVKIIKLRGEFSIGVEMSTQMSSLFTNSRGNVVWLSVPVTVLVSPEINLDSLQCSKIKRKFSVKNGYKT